MPASPTSVGKKSSGKDKTDSDAKKVPHPVYSDFVHMRDMPTLKFSVGLREDDPEGMMEKIVPLGFYKPGKPIEKKERKKDENEQQCTTASCIARLQKLATIKEDTKVAYETIAALESKVAASRNKIILSQKTAATVMERNESIKTQIEDLETRIPQIEEEIQRNEQQNSLLEQQLHHFMQELESLQESQHNDNKTTTSKAHNNNTNNNNNNGKLGNTLDRGTFDSMIDTNKTVIFAKKSSSSTVALNSKEIADVSRLSVVFDKQYDSDEESVGRDRNVYSNRDVIKIF